MSPRISLAALALSCAAAAQAGSTVTPIEVTSSVLDVCRFSSVPALNFGTLDPSDTSDKVVRVTLNFRCTAGVTTGADVATSSGPFVGVSGPATMKNAQTGATLPYTLLLSQRAFEGRGFSGGSDLVMELSAVLPASAFANAPRGDYKDTLLITWYY